MKTFSLFLGICLTALGQQQEKPDVQQQEKPVVTQEEAQPKAESKPEGQAAEEPLTPQQREAANAEKILYGTVDVGWRLRTDVGGDFNTWRSVVNQGEGPVLLGVDLTFHPDVIADQMRLLVNTWGPDPFTTARLDAEKSKYYRFSFDFRNLDYFNFLPSFANPNRSFNTVTGFTQRGYDLTRRSSDAELELFPSSRIVPYFAYTRSSGSGTGVQNFVMQGNEFPVPNRISDRADNYRGGVRLETMRFHVTLEGGYVAYRDSDELFGGAASPASPNPGNVTAPVSGQRLVLFGGHQGYGMRGQAPYTRALVTLNPAQWVNFTGAFMYSQPETKTRFEQNATGNFISFSPFAFFQGDLLLADTRATQPHPSAALTLELRPFSRMRVFESYLTDRLHTASTAAIAQTLFIGTASRVLPNESDLQRFVANYNQNEISVLFDILPRLTVRGGWRTVWGDTQVRPSIPASAVGLTQQFGDQNRNVGLFGITWRTRDKLSFTLDYEGGAADDSYYRTSLHDYQRARLQARYQLLSSLQLSARFNVLDNKRPKPPATGTSPLTDFSFLSRDNSFALYWSPSSGRRFSVLAEYTRSTLRSKTNFLDPTFPTDTFESFYRENAHIGTALVEIPLSGNTRIQPNISFGGSFYKSAGSRPTGYYQPMAKAAVPFGRWVAWNLEWRYYGLSQPYYLFEGFRAHTFVTGFRFSL